MTKALLPVLCALCISATAQKEHRVEFDPGIGSVTVYLNGGEVRASKEVELAVGRNTIVAKGLSPHTYAPSVQVTIKGTSADGQGIEILSVNSASNFLDPGSLEPRITRLQDSLQLLRGEHAELDDRIAASNTEKDMLARNHDIGGSGVVVSAEALAKAADFFRERTLLVNRTISKLEKESDAVRQRIVRTDRQLAELNYRHDPNRKDVTIVLVSERAQKARVDLRYLVGNTGWAPIYDLVAKDITQPITLRYKAQVYNNTGLDWSNVKMTLSTADPSLGASKPELEKWVLGVQEWHRLFGGNAEADGLSKGKAQYAPKRDQIVQTDSTQRYRTITVAEIAAEFPIARPYDIPSDAKPYLVDIAEHTVPAAYGYIAVPKLDRDAFLVARVTGWEKLNLVSGKANVYYGDAYVGESRINTASAEDTLDLSLGRDNNVQMTRKLVEDKTSKKLIGSERKETMTFEITVKNNSTAPLTLSIHDQVPVSTDSEIKVDVLETSNAVLDENDGLLTWNVSLQPGESRAYVLSFAVRYPKNKRVQVQQLRTVACPTF
ncbi:MAG: DUF4139 domain-containing protein [Flavobacteriales bacterium]|nr:DUF4139 domain-containing protein [Flavobacteriales bacterium]